MSDQERSEIEASTDTPAENATPAQTDPQAENTTQPKTDTPAENATQAQTDAPAESTTQAQTDAPAESTTQPMTDAPAEDATRAQTDPQAEAGARQTETGDIEAVKDNALPTPTADQFQDDKPAAEVNPADKAATTASSAATPSGANAATNAAVVTNAKPDVPAAPAPVPPTPDPSQVGGFQLAGGAARQTVAEQRRAERVALQPIRDEQERKATLSRRALVRGGFWTAMGMTIAGVGYCTKETIWPQNVQGFGGLIAVPFNLVPTVEDDPQYFIKGKFWLANISAGEGADLGFGEESESGGLLALYQKCPHLGCRVPYRGDFAFGGEVGWFRCPCHGSTYNRAGIRVFGPAPRPMGTMAIEVQADGGVIVNTGEITSGADDNPNRAVPYNASLFGPSTGRI